MVQRLGEVAAIYLARRGVAGVLLHLRRANTPGADYDWKHFAVVCAAIVKMTKEQRLEAFKGRAVYEIMRCLVTLSDDIWSTPYECEMAIDSAFAALVHTWGQFMGDNILLGIYRYDVIPVVVASLENCQRRNTLAHALELFTVRGNTIARTQHLSTVVDVTVRILDKYRPSAATATIQVRTTDRPSARARALAHLCRIPLPQHFGLNALAVLESSAKGPVKINAIKKQIVKVTTEVVARKDEETKIIYLKALTGGVETTALEWATELLASGRMA